MRRAWLLAFLLIASTASAVEVRVFAAASLTDALQELASFYERRTGHTIVFHFAASSLLARQIELGAPADLFLSADERTMDALARNGLVRSTTRVSALSNRLVVVVPQNGGKRIRSAHDLERVRLALGNPATVPAGIYAKMYLEKAGVWDRVAPQVYPTVDVRAALTAVVAEHADAAIVYRTDATISKRVRIAYEVPRRHGPAISYAFAVLRDAEQPRAAAHFLGFLRSPYARRVFERHGFIVP